MKDGLQRNRAATAVAESGFRIRPRSTFFTAALAARLCAVALWFVPWMLCAQGFTNSAALSAALDGTGTNLVVTFSMTTTQGWVTLFGADRPEKLATSAQPVDLAQVPPSRQGQFRVPINPAAPAQFYKLVLEQWPSRGKALVFTNGALDFAAMRATYGDITNNNQIGSDAPTNNTPMIFRQPIEVWVDNLGNYDTNGTLIGDNAGLLNGRYAQTAMTSINSPSTGFPPIGRLYSTNNDFRVNYAGDNNVPARTALLWSSEAQLYHDVNDYRNRFLNDAFIDALNLPSNTVVNLKLRQMRPDLVGASRLGKPGLTAYEDFNPNGDVRLDPFGNGEGVWIRTRGPYRTFASLPPLSYCFDSGVFVGDYAGLVAYWVLGTNTGFPPDSFYGGDSTWPAKVLSPINNGLSDWTAYRYGGDPEVYRYNDYAARIWAGRPCGGNWIACDKGENIRNVMMFDEANLTKDGVFPFTPPAGTSSADGPVASDLAAMYVAAIFYDIANEAGLGLYKADLLFWKTISIITNAPDNYSMRQFGADMQQAARALWPDPRPGRTGLSVYEEDVLDVLTSRGIPMNGVSNFRTNLPAAVGPVITPSVNNFASPHPASQPNVNSYNQATASLNGYTMTNSGTAYMALQFYKHSKYGPCDELDFTDGTFNPTSGVYNNDGTYYLVLQDRNLGNLTALVPGHTVRYRSYRLRCPDEATGFYAEDVQPFGYIVTKATPNGFSFTVSALSSNVAFKTYQLTIVDPSVATLGAATYAWTFTDYGGNTNAATGSVVQYTAYIDQPFTISIARTRASQTDTLTLRERGNDLDRSGGTAFVRNLVP